MTVVLRKRPKWQPCMCMRLCLKKHFFFFFFLSCSEDGKAVFTLLVVGSLAKTELLPTQIHVVEIQFIILQSTEM